MTIDVDFVAHNRSSTQHMRSLAARLADAEMMTPVGEHWTVAVMYAHLAFWDRRVMAVLDKTEQDGKLFIPALDVIINDLSLPLWAAIPPRAAARLGIEMAEELDRRLENFPVALLEEIDRYNRRWVDRSLHREEHLAEAEAALAHLGK